VLTLLDAEASTAAATSTVETGIHRKKHSDLCGDGGDGPYVRVGQGVTAPAIERQRFEATT
jgi:hypothetical protein